MSPPEGEWGLLAVDNQSKGVLKTRKDYWRSFFAACQNQTALFDAVPVIAWLRNSRWLGNAGNGAQIAQILDTR